MDKNGIYEDFSITLKRAARIAWVVEAVVLILLLYYWKVQVLDHKKFWALSESNRVREIMVPAPRGLITDRKNIVLATNIASFRTSIVRETARDIERSYRIIGRLLGLEESVLRERVAKYSSLAEFRPLVVKENLGLEEVARIDARRLEVPELVIEAEPKRSYPFGSFAAHVLGYMQEISQEEIRANRFPQRRLGDLVGKMGLEFVYEPLLSGRSGRVMEIVDSMGRTKGELERLDPKSSPKMKLTLDFDLQKRAEELLQGREGAIVILDAQTGGVLALASYPTYDPNRFINRFTPEEWEGIVLNPAHPLENRAIRGLYSPGSLFKLTMGLAGLESGLITDSATFFCGGTAVFYGNPFSCWNAGGHGSLALAGAIQHSCNIFFYNLGRRMPVDDIAHYARLMGFGERTGIDLPGEKDGLVPTTEWKKKTQGVPWFAGETISVAIGQGPLLVTPLQIAAHTAFIARRGKSVLPHLVSEEPSDYRKLWAERNGVVPSIVELKRSSFEKIIQGMFESVNRGGTGGAARVEGFDVCGKTGSTQTMSSERAEKLAQRNIVVKTHSWFTGFAPKDSPQVVIAVLVEYGGMGGSTAAPLAREMLQLYRSLTACETAPSTATSR